MKTIILLCFLLAFAIPLMAASTYQDELCQECQSYQPSTDELDELITLINELIESKCNGKQECIDFWDYYITKVFLQRIKNAKSD